MDPNLQSASQETAPRSEGAGTTGPAVEGGAAAGSAVPMAEKGGSQPYVFRRLSSFSAGELRKLRVRHEEFISSLAARLSLHLRVEISLKLSILEAMPFDKFIGKLSNPTYLALMKLEPLNGTCFLEIPPQLGLSVVDCELGGPGTCGEAARALTEIESRILARFVEINFTEWCGSWRDIIDLRPVLTGHESNGAYVQGTAPDTAMLVLGVEMQMGDATRSLHFGFPYLTLEPLIKKLGGESQEITTAAAKTPLAGPRWNPLMDDVRIPVGVSLPGLKITARALAALKVGDVIAVESDVLQDVRISLANKEKFTAVAGQCGTHWAARIKKVLEPAR